MKIDYIGPHNLRSIFENEYRKIEQDYERSNPAVIVGIPEPLMTANTSSRTANAIVQRTGFADQKEFDRYVDFRINKIMEAMIKGVRRGKKDSAFNQYMALTRELRKTSFILNEKLGSSNPGHSAAMYIVGHDTMYFDAYYTTLYLLGGILKSGSNDIPSQFRHELVHFELGDCVPFRQAREYYLGAA